MGKNIVVIQPATQIENNGTSGPIAISDVTNLVTTLAGKSETNHTHNYEPADGTILKEADIGVTIPALSHSHAISDVTDLTTTLSGKASSSHTHAQSDITNLATALSGKSDTNHTHSEYEPADATILKEADIGSTVEAYNANIQSHISSTSNPHSVTADQVLPTQTDNSGKFLTTDGINLIWGVVPQANGGVSGNLWYNLSGTFATVSTFTYVCTDSTDSDKAANSILGSLFTCTDSTGATRKIGYVKSVSRSTTTMTVTVVSDVDLASGDKDFQITPYLKTYHFQHLISIPGDIYADTTYSQGLWALNVKFASYLLPVDSAVITAASGTSASCAWNVYSGTTALFTSAQDLVTSATLVEKRPTTKALSAGVNISLRITASAGATTRAANFQACLFIVPQYIFNSL